jgi:hypothetical protein
MGTNGSSTIFALVKEHKLILDINRLLYIIIIVICMCYRAENDIQTNVRTAH